MNRLPGKGLKTDSCGEQNAFALACFRAIVSETEEQRPWVSVRDWNRAVQTLEIHGLLPILCRASEAPEDVQRLALEAKLRAATYQTNALDALNDISREMKAAGIPFAVLKGTYLYELLYRDLFPRQYGDIDLLVPSERIEDAVSALERVGYEGDRKRAGRPSMPRWHFHAALTSKKPGGLPVELHRSLVDRANLYRIREEELFGRLTEFRARQGGFTVLCAEDQLIYLCLHVAKHGSLNAIGLRNGFAPEWFCDPAAGNRLLWFLDIEIFLRKHKTLLDWPAVAERMERWNVFDDMMHCLRVIKALQPESQAEYAMERLGGSSLETDSMRNASSIVAGKAKSARRKGILDRGLQSAAGQALLARSMRVNPMLFIRPIRLFLVWRILAPSPSRLLKYHGRQKRLWLPWLYLVHPFHMLRKMLGLNE